MTDETDASGIGKARLPTRGKHRRHRSHLIVGGAKVLAALTSVVAVVVTGVAWMGYRTASAVITTSDALADEPASPGTEQNILIMGLDTRRDQQGRPLPKDIADALHAGDEDSGEGTADVLIVLHLPAGDGPATAFSIPRDDYVDLAGCPTSDCRGKIKEAYSFAYQRVIQGRSSGNLRSDPASAGGQDSTAKEQAAREAGRKAQVSTVRRLLQIPVDHFVELSLAGFFQIARVVEPISVCLNEDTSDRYYSGADFHRGTQQINAAQAMAFVRQRRDANDAMFTDLDRTRRQQAFMVAVINALRRGGALSDPARLRALLDIAEQNVAVDAGFNLEELMRNASAFADRPVALYTLPVVNFGEISDGEYVNFVDVSAIRSIVHNLVAADSPVTTSTGSPNATQPTGGSVALDVVNAAGRQGLAADLELSFATGHFTKGTASSADSTSQTSTIVYGPGAKAAATELADELGIIAAPSESVAPNTVRLIAGTDFSRYSYLDHTSASPTTTTTSVAPVTTVPATGTGTTEPTPANLTRMTADHIPCVK